MKDEALQMCLEYIETDEHERKYVRHAIKQALAAPVQEPVAWLENLRRLASICPELNMVNYSDEDVDDLNCWAIEVATCIDGITTPPAAQRQWVGLTDEEIDKTRFAIQTKAITQRDHELSRAIEAKLKEKNT
jgi:hypothetical protein